MQAAVGVVRIKEKLRTIDVYRDERTTATNCRIETWPDHLDLSLGVAVESEPLRSISPFVDVQDFPWPNLTDSSLGLTWHTNAATISILTTLLVLNDQLLVCWRQVGNMSVDIGRCGSRVLPLLLLLVLTTIFAAPAKRERNTDDCRHARR